jgi:hypothetical protein
MVRSIRSKFSVLLLSSLLSVKLFGACWTPPFTIDTIVTTVNPASAAVADSDQYEFLSWLENDNAQISASFYDRQTKAWSSPVVVFNPPVVLNGSAFDLASNSASDAVIIWSEVVGLGSAVKSSHFDPVNLTWSAPELIISDPSPTITPVVVTVDAAGNDIAVWGGAGINAARFDRSTQSWSAPLTLSPEEVDTIDLSMNPRGEAIAIWSVAGGSNEGQVQSVRFDPASLTWSSPTLVFPQGQFPNVGLDSFGNALAITQLSNGQISASRFNSATLTWSTPTVIFNGQGDQIRLSVSPLGDAFAAWIIIGGAQNGDVLVSRFNSQTLAWETPVTIDHQGINVELSVDAFGDAIAVTGVVGGSQGAVANASQFIAGTSQWSTPELISDPNLFTSVPFVKKNTNDAFAAWVSTPIDCNLNCPTGFVQAVQFLCNVLPPIDPKGVQCQNRFLTQTEFYNVITWQANSAGNPPVAYEIFRDAGLTQPIARIPGTSPLIFVDHNIKKGIVYTYYIVAVSESGDFSPPAIVSVPQKA